MTLSNIQKFCAYESIHLMLRLWKLTYSLTWCCMEHRQEWHRAVHPPSQDNQSGSPTSSHPTDKRKSNIITSYRQTQIIHRESNIITSYRQTESLTSSHPTDKRKSFTKKEETGTQPHNPASKSRSFLTFFSQLHVLYFTFYYMVTVCNDYML